LSAKERMHCGQRTLSQSLASWILSNTSDVEKEDMLDISGVVVNGEQKFEVLN
jgi:hypothetical protein